MVEFFPKPGKRFRDDAWVFYNKVGIAKNGGGECHRHSMVVVGANAVFRLGAAGAVPGERGMVLVRCKDIS